MVLPRVSMNIANQQPRDIFGSITFACFAADLSRAASACGMMLLPSA
jgi:hypothetical protein